METKTRQGKILMFVIFWWALVSALGCATASPKELVKQKQAEQGSKQKITNQMAYSVILPVAPPNVGFMYKPPVGWHEGGRGITIVNPASREKDLHTRVWIDGLEVRPVVYGKLVMAPVKTETGVKVVSLLPPGEEIYLIVDKGKHSLRAELYEGPAPYQLVGRKVENGIDFDRVWRGRIEMNKLYFYSVE